MRTRILTTCEELAALEADWRGLAAESGAPFFWGPDWAIPFWEHLRPRGRLHCLAAFEAGCLVGLAPLMVVPIRGLRCLQFLGNPLNDSNGFVAAPGARQSVCQELLGCLAADRSRWDILEAFVLDGASAIGHAAGPLRVTGLDSEPAPVLPLTGGWGQYVSLLPPERHRSFHYLERRFFREHPVEFRVSTDADDIRRNLAECERQRLDGWRQRGRLHELPPVSRSPQFAHFLAATAYRLARTGDFWLAELRARGLLVASAYYLRSGPRLLKYMQSWDYAYHAHSPGTVLDWMVIRRATEEGIKLVDFGRGDEAYKYRFGAVPHRLDNALLTPDSFRGRIAVAIWRGGARLRAVWENWRRPR